MHSPRSADLVQMGPIGQSLGLASISEARASACVSIYSRMFVNLPFRTVMAKTQWSSNVLFVALIFPVAKPTTRTRSPCATNSGGFGYVVSIVFGRLLKQIRQSRVSAVRTGQWPALARNDPLNIFGRRAPADLAYRRCQLPQKIPSQSGHSPVCSLNSLHFPYFGSCPV